MLNILTTAAGAGAVIIAAGWLDRKTGVAWCWWALAAAFVAGFCSGWQP